MTTIVDMAKERINSMTIIKLKHDFFIEVEDKNFTLKSEHPNKKTGKMATKTHGYFSTFECAIKNYIKLAALEENDGETIELHELLAKIKAVCDETIEVLKHG
jgi:hypothetical protein